MHPNGAHLLIALLIFAFFAWAVWIRPRWRGWLFSWLTANVAAVRPPDFIIGGKDRPYIRRWWVIPRNPLFNVYLHNILRDDDDRALHDHPWFNLSVVLAGGYFETTPEGRDFRRPGTIRLRSPWARHRLELPRDWDQEHFFTDDGLADWPALPAWSLFVTGPKLRTWGFWCQRPDGSERFVPWRDFVDPNDPGAVGPGCGEDSSKAARS